ncbi:MAG: 50S ribosomal protein L9 [Enterobacteriaceae bacterium]|nr:50S ribosomal protein L9 [Enterobacteriaceae bacterium]
MKIILLENIKNLGNFGDSVNVKNGYAKNYLFPFKKAMTANKDNVIKFKKEKDSMENSIKEQISKETYKINELNDISIIIPVPAQDDENIYGSINSTKILKIFKSLNINIKKQNLDKNIFIKKLGNYKLTLNFKKNTIKTKFFLMVIKNK